MKVSIKVDFDKEAAQSITDSDGFINRDVFIKFAKDTKLVDFGDKKEKDEIQTKEWTLARRNSKVAIIKGYRE
jgi:hypothetical protein